MSSVPLQTSHAIVLASGQPSATVRVKNIQATVCGPRDAWGRSGRAQPVCVSVTVHFPCGFGASSASDALAADTVHYGLLSKTVLATLDRLGRADDGVAGPSLSDILAQIWSDLCGVDVFASARSSCSSPAAGGGGAPFLRPECLRSLEVEVLLPKASLHGDGGVGMAGRGVFDNGLLVGRALSLSLHRLWVPILIGVNDNERLAKQRVVADLEVQRFEDMGDSYCSLEDVVVQAMTGSSFETIEALLADLAVRVKGYLVEKHAAPEDGRGWHLRIAVEKPIAVVFADAPCVELGIGTNDVSG